jgi:hypothetical protein
MTGLQPDEDVQMVIGLELRLLQPEVRASAGELEKLLHPDFHEFGASAASGTGPGQSWPSPASGRQPGTHPQRPRKSPASGWPMTSCI